MLFYLNQYRDLECLRDSLAVATLAHLCRDVSRLGMPRAKLPSILHLRSLSPALTQTSLSSGGTQVGCGTSKVVLLGSPKSQVAESAVVAGHQPGVQGHVLL